MILRKINRNGFNVQGAMPESEVCTKICFGKILIIAIIVYYNYRTL